MIAALPTVQLSLRRWSCGEAGVTKHIADLPSFNRTQWPEEMPERAEQKSCADDPKSFKAGDQAIAANRTSIERVAFFCIS